MTKINVLLILWIIFGSCFCHNSFLRSEEIPYSNAINIIKNIEKNAVGIKFNCLSYDLNSTKSQTKLLYDFSKKQYLFERDYTNQWVDGISPYISCRIKASSNGVLYREFTQCLPGTKLPGSGDRSEGVITKDLSDTPVNRTFVPHNWGIGIGIPFVFADYYAEIYKGTTLLSTNFMSDFLEHWNKNKYLGAIKVVSPNTWEITANFLTRDDVRVRLVLIYDIAKGGIVTNLKYFCYDPQNSEMGEVLENEYVVGVKETNNNKWVPLQVKKVHWKRGETILFDYSNVEFVNEISETELNFDFPRNTVVSDFVGKLYYRVGDIIDEDKAIDEFIQRNGLTGNVPRKITYGGIVRYILIGAGCLLILIALILHIRKRRQSP